MYNFFNELDYYRQDIIKVYHPDPCEDFNLTDENKLPNFSPKINLVELMQEVMSGIILAQDWRYEAYALWELRRMRKFFPELFLVTLNNIFDCFKQLIHHNRNSIARNSLRLIQEIFTHLPDNDQIPYLIEELVPQILLSLLTNKSESLKALEALVDNCYCQETFSTLLQGCLSQYSLIADISFDLIANKFTGTILNENVFIREEIFNQFDWKQILGTVVELFETKKDCNTLRAFKIYKYLYETVIDLFGHGKWEDILCLINDDLEFDYRLDKLKEANEEAAENYFNKIKYKTSHNQMRIKTYKKSKERNFWKNMEVAQRGESSNFNNFQEGYNYNNNFLNSSSGNLKENNYNNYSNAEESRKYFNNK